MLRKLLLAGVGIIGLTAVASAQTLVQQSPTQLQAAVVCQNAAATPAVNTQYTLTFPAQAGLYFYLSYLYLDAANDATGAAVTNLTFTSTNIPATPSWGFSIAGVNTNLVVANSSINPPIKSAAGGTAVTIVSPAAQTHTAFGMNACGYYAP